MFKAISPIKFGQLYIADGGRMIVIEPQYTVSKDLIVYEDANSAKHPIATAAIVDRWTSLVENYGDTLPHSTENLNAFSYLFRVSMLPFISQYLPGLPANFRENAVNALKQGKAKAFNHGMMFRI